MKKIFKFDFIFLLILCTLNVFVVSCSKEENQTTATTNPGEGSGGSGGTTGNVEGGTSQKAEICSGNTTDAEDDNPYDGREGNPIHIYQIGLGGEASVWRPGSPAFRPSDINQLSNADKAACAPIDCTAPGVFTDRAKRSNSCYYCLQSGYGNTLSPTPLLFSFPIPLKKDVWPLANNDGDIFIRIRPKSAKEYSLESHGGSFCYGRQPNVNGYFVPTAAPYAYTKIKVDVYAKVLRKIGNCDLNVNCTENDFVYTGTEYSITPTTDGIEIDVNKCSPIMRLPYSLIASNPADALVVEIRNVRTNSNCLEATARKNAYDKALTCPFYKMNLPNCWFATLQMATNETHFFKGHSRVSIP